MKKKLFLTVLALSLSLSLVACGGNKTKETTKETAAESAKETTVESAKETTAESAKETTAESAKETTAETTAEAALKGEAEGYKGKIVVSVTKKDGKITNVEVADNNETPKIGGEALKKLTAAVIEKGSVDGVDAVAGATITSNAFIKAVKEAK